MPSRDYHERLWEGIAEGLVPDGFKARCGFLLAHVAAGQHVLDVGCGEGWFTAALADAGCAAVGIDVADEPLRRGRRRRADLDLRRVDDDTPWPLQEATFDVVWAGEVIEHVVDTAALFSEMRRVLRPGGLLLVSTPNHGRWTILGMALRRDAFARHFDPRSDHVRFYTPDSLRGVVADFGFEQIETTTWGGVPGARTTLAAHARRKRW
jgi:2-polyprenyl-3-methyl-5-hydroxy-6-metoxy-1,4-benzoquinol methylase